MRHTELLKILPEKYREIYKNRISEFLVTFCTQEQERISSVMFYSANTHRGRGDALSDIYDILKNHEYNSGNQLI